MRSNEEQVNEAVVKFRFGSHFHALSRGHNVVSNSEAELLFVLHDIALSILKLNGGHRGMTVEHLHKGSSGVANSLAHPPELLCCHGNFTRKTPVHRIKGIESLVKCN